MPAEQDKQGSVTRRDLRAGSLHVSGTNPHHTATTSRNVTPLEQLLNPPAWHRDAACKEHPTIDFFPASGHSGADAIAVCQTCLVRAECAEAGKGEKGIWGGMSERERNRPRTTPQPQQETA